MWWSWIACGPKPERDHVAEPVVGLRWAGDAIGTFPPTCYVMDDIGLFAAHLPTSAPEVEGERLIVTVPGAGWPTQTQSYPLGQRLGVVMGPDARLLHAGQRRTAEAGTLTLTVLSSDTVRVSVDGEAGAAPLTASFECTRAR